MTNDSVAVRVSNLSKVYRLWDSPQARLKHPLKRLLARLMPWRPTAIGVGYRQFSALHDLSFEIRKGESWGFIGVNGSGKSTLLKIISGNLRPSAGRVEVDGKVVILDYGSGFNGEFTGEENIRLKAALMGLSSRQISERFNSIVDFAELGDFIKQPVKTYSSGMSARLGFAIMAHVDADVIITDEALAVGDVFFVQKCMAYIRSFLKNGTFLFVSHSTNDVLSLCQKAVWLEHGAIKVIGSAQEVTNAYLGSVAIARVETLQESTPGQESGNGKSGNGRSVNAKSGAVLAQPELSALMDSKIPRVIKDGRLQYLNHSDHRNDIRIPEFEFASAGIGAGGARITNVTINDEDGTPLSWLVGGEMACLTVAVMAERSMTSPIVGFQFKDRLGQSLFADNSFLVGKDQKIHVEAGEVFLTEFLFQMPLLPVGDYVVRAAVALGDEEGLAVPLHIIDNALVIQSVTSGARHGLVGVPMHSIRIRNTSRDRIVADDTDAKRGTL